MSFPITFGTLAAGPQPLSDFDTQFAAVGALVQIPCAATGQNAVVLTPSANTPTISAYTNYAPVFGWTQAQTSTGAVTIQVAGGLAALNAYKNNGATAVGTSDLVAGSAYRAFFVQTLNSGAGGFVVDVVPTALVAPGAVQGRYKNLVISNTLATSPSHQIVVTADALALFDGSSSYSTVTGVNFTIDATTLGVNGLDTGVFGVNEYYVFAIQNTSSGAVAGVLSTNSQSPSFTNLPGYAKFARVGAALCIGGPKFFNFIQRGNRQQFMVGTYSGNNTGALATVLTGSSGSVTTPTWTAVGVSTTIVPTTAISIILVATVPNGGTVIVAPNNNYGAATSNTNPAPIALTGGGSAQSLTAEIVLESTNIYYAGSTGGCGLFCLGYTDNL